MGEKAEYFINETAEKGSKSLGSIMEPSITNKKTV